MTLPRPTTDAEQAKADLAAFGCCLLADALAPAQLAATRSRLIEVAAKERADGTALLEHDGANQRVWQLLNRGPEFVELACNPLVLDIMNSLLGRPPWGMDALDDGLPQILLSNIAANIAGPGGLPMALHADQVHIPLHCWGEAPLMANVLWMLDDFTETNGATRVVPGSHTRHALPGPDAEDEAVPVEGPAGTALVFEGRLWHGTGGNTTSDVQRRGILAYYCSPWMRQQENSVRSVDPKVLATASPTLRRLMGFDHYASYGMVDGKVV
jgi:ectoine hydroxylase-related dioxygenase (phytanoyl-CoA dioxygenase family)